MDEGTKYDHGKIQPELVLGDFARALTAVCEVGGFGAAKYSPSDWLLVDGAHKRYSDAMLRHWLQEKAGESKDTESNLLHSAHLAWNALARLELELREEERRSACQDRSPQMSTPLYPHGRETIAPS